VRIVVAEGPSTSRGSGVAIGDGKVLTAWHVVRTNSSANIPTVYFQDGTQSKARVVKADDAFDLALLQCETPGPAFALLGDEPTVKESLTVVGYGPHPSSWRESRGRIIGRARPSSEHPMDHIIISTPARQGDSGGPVFNAQGHIAGILWGSEGSRTYATHAGRIREFLNGPTIEDVVAAAQCPDGKCGKSSSPVKPDNCPNGRCRK
jgi:S1-C subfamily serine protease